MFKYLLALGLALVLSLSGAIGLSRDSDTATSSGAVAVAGPNATPEQAVAGLEEQVRRVPTDHRAWANLGLACLELAGVTFEQELYAKADAAIEHSLRIQPEDNVAALANGSAISAS